MNLLERRAYSRKWYLAHPGKSSEYGRKLHRTKQRRAWMKKYRSTDKFRKQNRARATIYRAIKKGTLKRQICSIKKCKIIGQAHHPDYDFPSEIIWLCVKHHIQLHNKKI